ncbi:ubiquitinyl hydrolase 1 [Theileria orientalis]|uniref:Ubiquitinyl hydrolase 1 n=1 Tax=Theileria orientalis TaxID=68886 RepID=A0A976XK00_THEOR|nr:ubiquitinyl hydrolase 1 [Theileria orientalis]
MDELGSFYKSEQVLNSAQKKKLKKKQKQYEEQLELDQHIDSKIKLGEEEFDLIQNKLVQLGFKIHDIQPDGNCLFKSIEHQLKFYKESGLDIKCYSYKQLRQLSVDYLRDHKNEFKHFVANSSDDTQSDADELFDSYCSKMEKDGEWGSEIELQALSKLLMCKITVYNSATSIEYGNEGPFDINISFHRHQYVLGPHYNSIVPL